MTSWLSEVTTAYMYDENDNKKKRKKMANNMKMFQDLMYSTTSFEKKEILYR